MDGVKTHNATVAWIALVLAIVALIIGWMAFNRSGADLEDIVAEEVDEAAMEVQETAQEVEDDTREGTADALEAGADAADAGAEEIRTDEE